MGFNFGAMLGGAATQIVEDINEKEKDVKLRTRTILDRQVAQTAANQKEYKANKKKVTEQMNALVGLFGNTPEGIAKARDIVAGGDTHYTNMYGKLQTHADQGGDVNELVTLTKGSDDIGFTGVEQATDSIVKLAALPELKMGTGFGANYFKKEQETMINAGLIQTMQLSETAKKSYGQTKIDLTKMAKKAKSLEEIINEARAKRNKALQSGSQDEIKATEKVYQRALQDKTEESVAFKIKEMEAKADNNTTLRNVSLNYTASKKEFLGTLYNKNNRVVGDDGEVIREEKVANAYVRDKTKAYHLKVLDGYLDGNGVFNNPNAEKFVNANPTLKALLGEARRIKVGEDDSSNGDKPITRKEKIATFVKENPDVTPDVAKQFIDLAKKGTINSAKSLADALILKYPKKEGESVTEHQKRIDDVAINVWSEYSKNQEAQTELDKKNKLIREKRFTPDVKSDTSNASGMPNKQSYINNFGPTEGFAKYKAEVIKQLTPNFGSRAETVFNQMVKDGKA
jgi:hypothetical protein